MAGFSGKFESNKQEWETPLGLFNLIAKDYSFTLDVCASVENTKCANYFSEEDDALSKEWVGVCWMNPPYINTEKWLRKAYNESRKEGTTVVCLIPARTNTGWWHSICMKATEIRFLQGRPKFGDSKHGLPQPLALVVFSLSEEACKYSALDVRPLNKVERPNKEELAVLMSVGSFSSIGRKYGVSDNAVRKWAKAYGLL